MAMSEAAAAQEPGGPDRPGTGWLILQRLEDLRRAQDDLRRAQDDLRTDIKALDGKIDSKIDALDGKIDANADSLRQDLEVRIDSVRNWSLGLLLLAILGLMAKLLIPGA